ncbi:transcription-repair coupling factor, partial [Mesorhizobium sp. M7A.F.Ca.MR.228.00.0.0]
LPVLELPAWDCLPYDRVSPGSDAAAKRLDALTAMIALAKKPHRAVILTTANALLQRIPPADLVEAQTFHARPGNQIDMNVLVSRLETSGFERVPTVRGIGEFAVRGGILDLFAPGWTEALRLDFFGDTLESIRVFDAATQRTTGQRKSMALQAMSEVALTPETISRFRRSY